MIVRILKPTASFGGVRYNTNKVDRNRGELMKVANFGPLQGLGKLKPQDYVNYLKMVTSLNTNIKNPQFHAIISAKGKSYDKHTLTTISEAWLKEMGYGAQPYLIVYHKDTGNNHVHMVTTRVDREGRKINSGFEHVRAVQNLAKVLGYDLGFQYKFSTRAQFLMVLEANGFLGIDPDEAKIKERIDKYQPDKKRAAEIRQLFQQFKFQPDFRNKLKEHYQIELIFHTSEGKKPYGYSIIDNENFRVFKGSEVLPLKELLAQTNSDLLLETEETEERTESNSPAAIQSIWIADDVDDQQIHGMRRRRQKKARTNTR